MVCFRLNLVLVIALYKVECISNYASVRTCKDKGKHIMMTDKTTCKNYAYTFTKRKSEEILKSHNSIRNRWANKEYQGQLARGFQGAANMMKMTWDDELAMLAQENADKCNGTQDECRDIHRFQVEQLILEWQESEIDSDISKLLTEIVDSGSFLYPTTGIDNFRIDKGASNEVFHNIFEFTQVIWALTQYIGCGESTFYDNSTKKTMRFLVCNYGPKGNYEARAVYRAGKPCSKCPSKYSCSDTTYNHLCSYDNSNLIQTDNLLLFFYILIHIY